MNEQTFAIGEMCAEFDVTPRSLRFYEYKELLAPIREGQKRLYTQREKARLKLILRGKRFGFSLAEIKELLELYYADASQVTQLTATLETAETRLAGMISQRDELDEAIRELTNQMEMVKGMLAGKSAREAAE